MSPARGPCTSPARRSSTTSTSATSSFASAATTLPPQGLRAATGSQPRHAEGIRRRQPVPPRILVVESRGRRRRPSGSRSWGSCVRCRDVWKEEGGGDGVEEGGGCPARWGPQTVGMGKAPSPPECSADHPLLQNATPVVAPAGAATVRSRSAKWRCRCLYDICWR
jgi:hypothetical protein